MQAGIRACDTQLRKDITAQKMLAEQSFQLLQNAVDSDEKVANNLIEETKSAATDRL